MTEENVKKAIIVDMGYFSVNWYMVGLLLTLVMLWVIYKTTKGFELGDSLFSLLGTISVVFIVTILVLAQSALWIGTNIKSEQYKDYRQLEEKIENTGKYNGKATVLDFKGNGEYKVVIGDDLYTVYTRDRELVLIDKNE